jgi:electron transfer flavoprotein alpha subunit
MSVLVLAELDENGIVPQTRNAVTAAAEIDSDVHLLVAGQDCGAAADAGAKIAGVAKVLKADDAAYANGLAENVANLVTGMASSYGHLVVGATSFGKNVMPRIAALLDVQQLSEITEVKSADTFVRPIYAGNAIITVEADPARVVVATIRTASWAAAASGSNSAPVEALTVDADLPAHTRFIELQQGSSDRPDLQSANKVVSGGRGVGSKENFDIIYKFADKIGAAVGASRAAVDAGYCPNEMQVGQTGKIIAPELYMAIGISGAIQHLTGIKDAGTIVAINKDSDAPIFEVADFGLVGDLFKLIPELEQAL